MPAATYDTYQAARAVKRLIKEISTGQPYSGTESLYSVGPESDCYVIGSKSVTDMNAAIDEQDRKTKK